jgi:RNA-directed DNA polymerase
LLGALAERVVDRKILKAIRALLGAGILVGQQLLSSDTGTPQGGVATPPTHWATSSSMSR